MNTILAYQIQKLWNDLWVKMLDRLAFDILEFILFRPCRTVWTVRNQRIINIHQSKQPGRKWDLISAKFIGVACAIPFFMMPMWNVQCRREICYGRKQVHCNGRMAAHDLPFIFGQRSWLE